MKKYFLFDDEPISGWGYLLRILVSSLLVFLLVGFWTASATAYKRSGALGWKKDIRIASAVLIPIHVFLNVLPDEIYETVGFGGTFFMIVLILGLLHLILLFKNGNKKKIIDF